MSANKQLSGSQPLLQANEPPSVAIELHSLRQEVKALHKELDSLAQGTDHPEVKRFAGKHWLWSDSCEPGLF